MSTQHTNPEIERLLPELSEANRLFLEEIARRVRKSPFSSPKAEYALLDTARQMLKFQKMDKSFLERYNYDPEVYTEELLNDLEMRKPRTRRDKVKYYTMIPWVALTWVFFIYTALAFFDKWFNEGDGQVTVKLSTLLIVAAGAILLIELMTRFLGAPDTQNTAANGGRRPIKTELKTLVLTIGTAIVVIAVYVMLQRLLPAFTLTPWSSLILFVVGLIGQYFFLRKPASEKRKG